MSNISYPHEEDSDIYLILIYPYPQKSNEYPN